MSILGHPLTGLFLYFMFYAFLGWVMESCYCSLKARRVVPRGFLFGPICPIYGVGALLMILFFTPLKGCVPLFYVVAVVVMTSWEYFVGWLLERTTHMKYWDYSHLPHNLHGRVCLRIALVWGVLSYVVMFWVHPPVERLYGRIPQGVVYLLCGVLLVLLVVDLTFTLRRLALISHLVSTLTAMGQELQLQLALGRAELEDSLEARSSLLRQRYSGQAEQLRLRYQEQLMRLEKYTRPMRSRYRHMRPAGRYVVRREDIQAAAELAREALQKRRQARHEARAGRKAGSSGGDRAGR